MTTPLLKVLRRNLGYNYLNQFFLKCQHTSINLAALNEQLVYQRVAITVKVIDVGEVKCLADGRQLQTVQVADKTGKAKLDLRQSHVGTLGLMKTYHIKNAMVKVF